MAQEDVFTKLVSHCKEYGFVFPSSDIYDGLGAVYDYGQMGVELKNNIKKYWWDSMVLLHENIVGIDSAIFMMLTNCCGKENFWQLVVHKLTEQSSVFKYKTVVN